MSGGGGKGGSQSSKMELPAWLETPMKANIARAEDIAKIGYTPYYGPDVAAFTQPQMQAMQGYGNAAAAFGMAPEGYNATEAIDGMTARNYHGGTRGYSSQGLYDQILAEMALRQPDQVNSIQKYTRGELPTERIQSMADARGVENPFAGQSAGSEGAPGFYLDPNTGQFYYNGQPISGGGLI